MLIELDCADLLYAIEEGRGRPGEPIVRLATLGWTCVGNSDSDHQQVIHTNFACTYFVKDQSDNKELNDTLKQFWEIENVSSPHETPTVRIEDQLAVKRIKSSLTYENQMYRIGIPWKKNKLIQIITRWHTADWRIQRNDSKGHLTSHMHTASALTNLSRKGMSERFKRMTSLLRSGTYNTFRFYALTKVRPKLE